jgi:hypothetical protein
MQLLTFQPEALPWQKQHTIFHIHFEYSNDKQPVEASLEFHYQRHTQPNVVNCCDSLTKFGNLWNVYVHAAINEFYLNFHQTVLIFDFILTGTLSTRVSSIGDASKLSGRSDVLLLNTDGVTSDGNSSSRSTCLN